MITLLLFYILPTLIFLFLWVSAGWKFSLSAAPRAYELANALYIPKNSPRYNSEKDRKFKELQELEKHLLYNGNADDWYELHKLDGKELAVRDHMNRISSNDPEGAARSTGKKCIVYGPFAYFLTPMWQTKIECNWYPVDVNVAKIQTSADNTLKKLEKVNDLELP
jgi:hypothetical protein